MPLLNCDIQKSNTRTRNSVHLSYCGANVEKLLLHFQGPRLFNSLSKEIQNASNMGLLGLFGVTQVKTNMAEFSAECHGVDCSGHGKVSVELQMAIRSKLLF